MPPQQEKEPKLYQEIAAISCLFLGVFLLLSLVSYTLPLFEAQPIQQKTAENWCGEVGYYTAFYLFSFVGLISFFPTLLLFHLGGNDIQGFGNGHLNHFTVLANLRFGDPVFTVQCLNRMIP
ncbi:MAG: hypothetical protein D3924_13950, partial [Candidatus Electrothrix sp. AR4]|nr:hypothetical protein [Candidatus Electrothrix sp. AR4]